MSGWPLERLERDIATLNDLAALLPDAAELRAMAESCEGWADEADSGGFHADGKLLARTARLLRALARE